MINYVYLMVDEVGKIHCKIGHSDDPKRRLKEVSVKVRPLMPKLWYVIGCDSRDDAKRLDLEEFLKLPHIS